MKRIFSFLCFSLLAYSFGYAQTEMTEKEDTIIVNLQKEFLATSPTEAPLSAKNNSDLPELESALDVPKMNWTGLPSLLSPSLPSWGSGGITGYNGIQQNFMLGGIYHSGASIYQNLGRYWTVSAGFELTKYGVAYNQAYFNGSIVFHPTDNFSLTLFGAYSPGSFLSPMQIGKAWYAGGYISLETDSHWGIDLGARHGYDSFSGHNLTPILRPYYKVGGTTKIGIDFGPMLQHYFNKNGRSNTMEFNPVMPRPMNGLPPVAPRR